MRRCPGLNLLTWKGRWQMPRQLPHERDGPSNVNSDKVTLVTMRKDVRDSFGHLRLGPDFHYVLAHARGTCFVFALFSPCHKIPEILVQNIWEIFYFILAFLFKYCSVPRDLSWSESAQIFSHYFPRLRSWWRNPKILEPCWKLKVVLSRVERGKIETIYSWARIKSRASQICYRTKISPAVNSRSPGLTGRVTSQLEI